ncbi:hypothetical protein NSA24_11625 [Clostridioides mangenotii]|nr:hypothetical protein [Clostridioides mangenotii]
MNVENSDFYNICMYGLPGYPIGSNDIRKDCVLYSNDAYKTIAEVFAWSKENCVVMDIKDFKSYTADNLFVVGGRTKEALKKMNLPERYTVFNGVDRWDTLNKVLNRR